MRVVVVVVVVVVFVFVVVVVAYHFLGGVVGLRGVNGA